MLNACTCGEATAAFECVSEQDGKKKRQRRLENRGIRGGEEGEGRVR